ncbi:unnamed protein product [Sordaria macrospora k-hell]|uniref:WGS project CABT00000000 data, contig 2.41 n=1 Tax=Sordaria macrospora (strain ATCC MYA-333 / DSM 997 / K(L3346) / K-hell) TaxID=771870 RepID=F7W7X9_SORMK|nr:uncharacterized protein SMAC_07804 [Sordaria macrospora k-hell]CCC13622.1 unnamed protein product [Sordaria macrospora k-hell]
MSSQIPAFQKGNTALITGGASGIGLALAQRLLSYGLRVLVADKDASSLYRLSLAPETEDLIPFEMDVAKLEDWHRLKTKISEAFNGQLNVLALNAGRGLPTSFTNPDPTNFYETMQTNLFGVINGVTTLLPLVQSTSQTSGPSSIIITGSKQGITNPPSNPAYNASKSAVKTLAEHLAFDLSKSDPSVLNEKKEKEKPAGAWWPEQVIDYLEKKMEEGKFYVICPDNDVSEEMDKRRMVWAIGDVVEGRPPLTRWRAEDGWKERAEEGMKKLDV